MLAQERHRQIVSRCQDDGIVRVAALAHELRVTEETIRRDLEKLDLAGKVLRVHGGAVPRLSDRRDVPFNLREVANLDRKRLIAVHALRHIVQGEVIALDASSTVRELARLLPDAPLTVITNSLVVAGALLDRPRVRVISTGGILDAPSLSYLGSMAEAALERFHLHKLFVSCQAVDPVRGLSVTEDEHARIKRRMLDLADRVVLLADSTKFGNKAVEFFARLTEVHAVITDAGLDPAMRARLEEAGVPVEVAGELRLQ